MNKHYFKLLILKKVKSFKHFLLDRVQFAEDFYGPRFGRK